MIEETVKIDIDDFRPLLEIEKSYRLYKMSNVKKLDFGYVCQISFLKLKIDCLCKPKKDGIEIIEKNGKFLIDIHYEKKGNSVEAKIIYRGSLEKILGNIARTIAKNLEEYAKYVVSKNANHSGMVTINLSTFYPDKTIDLRGEECPVPEITLKKELIKAKKGEVIEVLLDHPAAILYTIPEIIRLFNCRYEVIKHEDYVSFRILVLGNTVDKEEYFDIIHEFDQKKIKELIKDKQFTAFLYTVFTKMIKTDKVSNFATYNFNCDGVCLVTSAPLGRGWLSTAIVKGDKIICCRIDLGNQVLFDEEALNYLKKQSGEANVIYLSY